ncbi:MAG: glycosyltransferase, partial [Muribaculaceae bacterium]|nr:glycosyltransferase [Muribaculaceae bacterium]
IDLFLDSVNELRAIAYDAPVLALVMVPAWSRDARADLNEALAHAAHDGTMLADPVITHNLNNPDCDPIINRIHQLNFNVIPTDNINVIYVPCYLNGNDGVFGMTYYDLLPGLDITVFPSYYEPWGYTPLESVAFGVPTVTTTLSGFGQWVLSSVGNQFDTTGVKVVERTDSNYDAVCDAIAYTVSSVVGKKADIKALGEAARHTSSLADWSHFIGLYVQAFEIALNNSIKRNK